MERKRSDTLKQLQWEVEINLGVQTSDPFSDILCA